MYRIADIEIDDGPHLQCAVADDLAIHEGDQCVLQHSRALEYGRVVRLSESPDDAPPDGVPRLVRQATLQDQAKEHENLLRGKMAREKCEAKATEKKLEMRIVRVRYSFDMAMLYVDFTAGHRVDFRAMVKELSGDLRTRLEMRQIGVRDEAGLIGGMGPCGRNLCCCSWLDEFESVNVKMAKAQRLSLNPTAISGMCGRLKCCLRYEYENYRECERGMPRDGQSVACPEGKGRVMDHDILSRKVRVRLDDDRVMTFDADDVQRAPSGGLKRRCHRENSCPERA